MNKHIFDDIDISIYKDMSEEEVIEYLEWKYWSDANKIKEVLIFVWNKFNNILTN
jgi:hypothetical protein